MKSEKLFNDFCNSRNIKKSTRIGYVSALKLYTDFHEMSLDDLIAEAVNDECMGVVLKDRKLKKRLLDFRTYLFSKNTTSNTIKTYFSKIRTFYKHFEIEIPILPQVKYNKDYICGYNDLPSKSDIGKALDLCSIDYKAIILFMSSSGTAKAETLSLTVSQFIQATSDYHNGGDINEILYYLIKRMMLYLLFI